MHLRELGCRVEGVGQEGKTGADSHRAYDEFVEVPGVRRRSVRASPEPAGEGRAAPRRRGRTASSSASSAQSSPASAAAPSAAPAPSRAAAPARQSTAARRPALPPEVALWLEVVPGLASGSKVELGVAAEALRKHGLLSRNASSTKLFRKYPESFELAPARQPNAVHYRGPT